MTKVQRFAKSRENEKQPVVALHAEEQSENFETGSLGLRDLPSQPTRGTGSANVTSSTFEK